VDGTVSPSVTNNGHVDYYLQRPLDERTEGGDGEDQS
jgi:hypothetical protein